MKRAAKVWAPAEDAVIRRCYPDAGPVGCDLPGCTQLMIIARAFELGVKRTAGASSVRAEALELARRIRSAGPGLTTRVMRSGTGALVLMTQMPNGAPPLKVPGTVGMYRANVRVAQLVADLARHARERSA